jgi:hypothetical protein
MGKESGLWFAVSSLMFCTEEYKMERHWGSRMRSQEVQLWV